MIGRLRGTLAEKQPPHLILDVNGVGYEVEVPMTTLYRLPAVGEPLTLHTHLVVREDAHLLYGFFEKRERELFRELIRLNGVGPKLAERIVRELKDKIGLDPAGSAIAAGTKVRHNSIAPLSASTTVMAMGWNILPSTPVRANTGR